MDDLISRQAVKNTLTDWQMEYAEKGKDVERFETLGAVIELVERMPTIDPVKHGKWIDDAKTYYEQLNERGNMVDEYTPYFSDDIACSECLAKYSMLDNETQFFKFCPNCGAKM